MTDEQSAGAQPDPVEDEATRQFREQQAIASALLIGEEMQRETQAQLHYYAKRIGIFVSVLALLGMIMLYSYARLKSDFNPLLGMLLLGFVAAAAATMSYWAHVESRHAKKD